MRSIIILVRHGETMWNEKRLLQGRTDIALGDKGREQAKVLSSALSSVPLRSVYCSPLARAAETAEILSYPHRISPKIDEGFIEINFGEWEGRTPEALGQDYPRQYERWLVNPNDVTVAKAELLGDVQNRVMRSFERIAEENEGNVVCIVGHGGINRVLLLSLLQADLGAFWRLRQDTACLNLIEFSDDIPRISLLNCTAHFKKDYTQIVKEAMIRMKIQVKQKTDLLQ